jgi:hypothetical protein
LHKAGLTNQNGYANRNEKNSRCDNNAYGKQVNVLFIFQQAFIPITVLDEPPEFPDWFYGPEYLQPA